MPASREAPSARAIAAHVLARVFRDRSFAAAVLDANLDRYPTLDPRDRALATELVYGALRTTPFLLERVESAATRGIRSVDPITRAHLVVAAYQIFFLDRVPHFAAVSEAVEQVRQARGPRVGAFANAVLRKLCLQADASPTTLGEALARSAPRWLRAALERAVGEEAARALLDGEQPPPIGLRVRHGQDRDAALARLRELVPQGKFEPGRVSPACILGWDLGDPEELPGVRDGSLAIQEQGAQLIALALGAREGERVLDACAGRGNKTELLAELPRVTVDSADLHPSKLGRIEQAHRGRGGKTFAVDWTVGPGDVPAVYDRVLVDAPCSGVGTLRRRPELALRLAEEGIGELADRQAAIACSAATRLKPGGTLLYAVCSVLQEEGEAVVGRVLTAETSLEAAPLPAGPAGELAGGACALRLLPHLHETDGYFLACFRRRA